VVLGSKWSMFAYRRHSSKVQHHAVRGSLMQCPRVSGHSCRTPQENPTQPSNPSIANQGSDGVIAWGHNSRPAQLLRTLDGTLPSSSARPRQSKQDPSSPAWAFRITPQKSIQKARFVSLFNIIFRHHDVTLEGRRRKKRNLFKV